MALTTFTDVNNHSDPITQTNVDSATFSTPTNRATTFTPLAGYALPTSVNQTNFGVAGNDWSFGSTPAQRPQVFEPPSFNCTLDPGMIVNG